MNIRWRRLSRGHVLSPLDRLVHAELQTQAHRSSFRQVQIDIGAAFLQRCCEDARGGADFFDPVRLNSLGHMKFALLSGNALYSMPRGMKLPITINHWYSG